MSLVQISSCSSSLGTCCSDYGIVKLLDIIRRIFDLIQLVVPILLIVMATVSFIRLLANPELKQGTKKIINQFLAAAIVFFLPTILNVVLGILPDTTQVGACWETAKVNAEIVQSQAVQYQKPSDIKSTPVLVNPDKYEKGEEREDASGTIGSAKGKEIVAYAKKFLGKRYELYGKWDGEEPYSPTCCAGFVSGVYKHFGYKIYNTNAYYVPDLIGYKKAYVEVNKNDIQAGDIVFYSGHVAMLTGNGKEIIHASNPTDGVKLTQRYNYSGSTVIKIVRIKGVE